MHTIQIRIDKKTKQDAKRVLDRLGLDMSSAVKIYLRQITTTNGIPFSLMTKNGFRASDEQRLIDESNETLKAHKAGKLKGYRSVKKMMKDLLV